MLLLVAQVEAKVVMPSIEEQKILLFILLNLKWVMFGVFVDHGNLSPVITNCACLILVQSYAA